MVLVDTSVWVDHLRKNLAVLVTLLQDGQVLAHPFVTGELALGNLRRRATILDALGDLPQARVADAGEVLHFIESAKLSGRGIGYVDAHLLAAVQLTPGARLWTHDKRLALLADKLDFAF